jgi:hypothetical protein
VHAVPYGARLSFLMISMTLSLDCFAAFMTQQNEKPQFILCAAVVR